MCCSRIYKDQNLRGYLRVQKVIKSKGKHARTKGHSFERFIAQCLRVAEVFPEARRQLEYHIDDCKGVDLVNTGIYKLQCKKLKKYAPLSAIKEIECDELLGDVPVLVTQGDRERILVCLPFEEWVRLVRLSLRR